MWQLWILSEDGRPHRPIACDPYQDEDEAAQASTISTDYSLRHDLVVSSFWVSTKRKQALTRLLQSQNNDSCTGS